MNRKVRHFNSADYYCSKWFRAKNLKQVQVSTECVGSCPWCGQEMVALTERYFQNIVTKAIICVHVTAAYAECQSCGCC